MALTLYYLSGSPYAWRVWLALEHKRIAYELKALSYDAGDFKDPAFRKLNPRQRVPVIVDNGFALYESAAIVEYLEDKQPGDPRLFSSEVRERAVQRRMVREADQYFATALEHLVEAVLFTPQENWSDERIASAYGDIKQELALWETMICGEYLSGTLSAADFTLYPEIALVQRMGKRKRDLVTPDLTGPKIGAWMERMQALPVVQKTWPPHWRE
ncbi:MAG: glutathione S-transferase family protein [Burkholderiales bacterium]